MSEIIYIFINEAMPGYVKIGRTTNLNQRLKSLYRTPVPLPFECFYACTVENGLEIERWLFDVFDDRRVSKEREFFEVAPERVAIALRARAIKEVTPTEVYVESEEDKAALNRAQQRGAVFNFGMVNIPVGAELIFSRDKNIKAMVVDNRKIKLNGEILSLSAAADKVLQNMSIKWKAVQGPAYWIYEGETLDERKHRFERGDEFTEEEIDAAGDRYIQAEIDKKRGK